MKGKPTLDEITIRTTLQPGDIGYVIHRHGKLYGEEYGYGVSFESYVASGMAEFYRTYDPLKDCVWIAEHNDVIVGFLLLMHREGDAAQLRYFYLESGYRGIGLGKKLMSMYMEFLRSRNYKSSYLWTTDELFAAAGIYKKLALN
ncbi:MAG: GNAT family N-acetyltransferase [Bacteroidota bacterium]